MALFRDCQDNGVVSSYNYDVAGRLLDLVHQLNATNVGAFSYTYDNVGNRTSMTDEYGTHSYVYDQLSRLIQATHPQPANPMLQFAYDPVGNRLGGTYDAGNRLLEDADYYYDYDKNGNTTQKLSKTTGELSKLYYDAENQLTKLEKYHSLSDSAPYSTVSYIYDGLGRRVAKRVNGLATKYMYDNEDVLFETEVSDQIIARYTHGPGIDEPISMDRGGNSYYYVADGLGSIVKLVDAAGTVVNNYVYDSFGSIVDKAETVPNPYTYTGREYDAESGLYYYRARYYDAKTGRFLSEVPIGFLGGANFYTYVLNNPVKWIDSWGLKIEWGDFVITNPQVRTNLERLNQEIINTGKPDNEFVLRVTGGDRALDGHSNIISLTNGEIIDTIKVSPHLIENGARAVDLQIEGVTHNKFDEALRKTGFYPENTARDYKDSHTHIALPNYQQFYNIPYFYYYNRGSKPGECTWQR